jgi:hypothetical protein
LASAHLAGLCVCERQTSFGASLVNVSDLKAPPPALQVSNDVRMLLPILVGILVAKWVADAATHSLYHGLLEACTPSSSLGKKWTNSVFVMSGRVF